jgi:hypothetical protein
MDNTLLSGIMNSLATLTAGFVGAIATIVAALMSKTYADKQISRSKTYDEIKPLTSRIIRFLSLFRVTGASIFVVKNDKTHIDAETGISIAIHNHDGIAHTIDVTYHLPGQIKPQVVKGARLGWRVLVNYQNSLYTLTLVSMGGGVYSFSARFDFRKISHVITEVKNV